jgi:hypothetical protein
MSVLVTARGTSRPARPGGVGRLEVVLALAAFAVLCVVVLRVRPFLVEPDDYAYRASIVAATQGHFFTLSSAQAQALATRLGSPGGLNPGGPAPLVQWVQLANGRWISEKDPGYPYLAAPFQALGLIRLVPLFFGALACAGLFAGGRRWLGPYGGTVAVALYCSSGAALVFAWRDYMPTFTDASLAAAGTGALLWALLAVDAPDRRRTWCGLAGFVALEAATFTRYTDIVILACAVLAVAAALIWWRPAVPAGAWRWWLGSVAVFGAGVAVFDALIYGGPLRSGYRPGEIQFSPSAVGPNLRYMPVRLVEAMPMLVLGLLALFAIAASWVRRGHDPGLPGGQARRDLAVGLGLGASWAGMWGLYAAYTWTARAGAAGPSLPLIRFYLPAAGAIALLAAWPVVRGGHWLAARRRWTGLAVPALALAVLFGLGIWSFTSMTNWAGPLGRGRIPVSRVAPAHPDQGPGQPNQGPAQPNRPG